MIIVSGAPMPVIVSTESPITQAALRVVVVTGAPPVDGKGVPVYVVSDAQAAAGYAIQSNTPVPVQVVAGPPTSQRPIPVYVVSGSLSPAVQTYTEKALAIQTAHLLAYWRLNETSGTVANNAQGVAARNGTYSNVTLGAAGVGDGNTAATFNGTTSNVNVYSASLASAFNGAEGTVAAWCKVSGAGVWTDGVLRRIATFLVNGSNYAVMFKHTANNTIRCDYSAGGTVETVSSTAVGGSLVFFSVAMTWSKAAEQMKVYINGAQVGTTQTALGVFAGTIPSTGARIGAAENAASNFWSGSLAHVALWDTPLSAAEVAALATV